ncbi:MAG: Na+/H+ antiporter subunit G [Firmicutes bacterium]|nr:Na+/H+ antiporter subunit G [Bacillota bacterium]
MIILEAIISLFLVIGALIALIGTIGLARLPDIYTRLHGPAKASTLGVGATLFGSFLYFTFFTEGVSMQEALITAFLFVTAPVSANMIAKAALHRRVKCTDNTQNKPFE